MNERYISNEKINLDPIKFRKSRVNIKLSKPKKGVTRKGIQKACFSF